MTLQSFSGSSFMPKPSKNSITRNIAPLSSKIKCGQRYVGLFAQILPDGDVGTNRRGRRRHDTATAEPCPLVLPQGSLDEQVSDVVVFPIGKDRKAAGLPVVVQKQRRSHGSVGLSLGDPCPKIGETGNQTIQRLPCWCVRKDQSRGRLKTPLAQG